MDIIITISKKIEDLLGEAFVYQTEISDSKGGLISNPETKQEYITRITEEILKDKIREHKVNESIKTIYESNIDLQQTTKQREEL